MSATNYIGRTSFAAFVDFAFRELNPEKPFLRNWHIHIVAGLLQMLHRWEGDFPNRVIINLPPGYLKTHICAISYPCWLLGRDPRKSVLLISATPGLARQLLEQCRELMESTRYRAMFPKAKLKPGDRSVETVLGGSIRAAGIGHASEHKKSDVVILDNPENLHNQRRLKPELLAEICRLQKDRRKGAIILATRRLSTADLSGSLRGKPHGWGQLSIPVVALEDEDFVLPHTRYRRRKGELLHPEHEKWKDVMEHLAELGGDHFIHQYLQSKYLPRSGGSHTIDFKGQKVTIIGGLEPTAQVTHLLKELRARRHSNLTV